MTIKMVTLKEHVYGAKRLRTGDKFTVSGQSDARLLTALKRAYVAPAAEVSVPVPRPAWMDEPEAPIKRTYATKTIKAKEEDAPKQKPAARRLFQRRDMTAED